MADPLASMNAWGSPLPPQKDDLPPVPINDDEREGLGGSNGTMGPPHLQRDPRTYGVTGPTLIDASSNTAGPERIQPAAPFIRVRLGSIDRNKKDLLIRFDLSTNLPSFRATLYRNIQRSYADFGIFAEQIAHRNPQTIVPALPLPQTSAVTDEEDDRLVRIALQRWFARVCDDPILQRDDELRSFVESDFGASPLNLFGLYQPSTPRSQLRSRATASSSTGAFSSLSKVFRKGPPDEDEDLQAAKGELERLEERWAKAASAVNSLGKARKTFAVAEADSGGKLVSLSTVEPSPDLALAMRSMGRAFETIAGLMQAQAVSDNVILSDSLGYQSLNAKSAKETLNQRTHVLEEAQAASKAAINKRRVVERMKGSSNINPAKVDDALEDMREAQDLDHHLAQRVQGISMNLRSAIQSHSRRAHEDIAVMLLEHAKSKIMQERHVLKELESVRPDITNIGKGVVKVARAAPSTGMQRTNSMPGARPMAGTGSYYQSTGGPSQPSPFVAPNASGYLPPNSAHHPSGMSQSMYVGSTQPRQSQFATQPHSAYPQGTQISGQLSAHPSAPSQRPDFGQYNSSADPLGAPSNVPHNVHSPPPLGVGATATTYNNMAQSLYIPGGSKAPGGYGGPRRIDDRAAARSLANMF